MCWTEAKHADPWKIEELLADSAEKGLDLDVRHVNAHRT